MSRTLQDGLAQIHRQIATLDFTRRPCEECKAIVAAKSPIICAGARTPSGDEWFIFSICRRCRDSGLLPNIRVMVAAGGDPARWISAEFAQSIPGLIDISAEVAL